MNFRVGPVLILKFFSILVIFRVGPVKRNTLYNQSLFSLSFFQDFKRTHQDNWAEHKQAFTEDQLAVLTDLLVSPSYYA